MGEGVDAHNAIAPQARIIGVSVQEMVGEGVEVISGVNCDPQLGPVLLFGGGGVMVEVYDDVAPLKAHEIYEPRTLEDLERERRDLAALEPDEESRVRARQAAANIIARRKGVTLGGLSIKDLINEGRR
jgi:hypothetical protein